MCGSGGTGVYGSTVTTTTAASTITTTIIPQPSKVAVNSTYNVSNTVPTNISVAGLGLILTLLSSKLSSATVFISNVTSLVPNPPAGFNDLLAVNISVKSAANVSTNITLDYPCSIQASNIVPYKLNGTVWQPVATFKVNATKCSVTFSITNDPIIGLFQKVASQTTAIATTTIGATTVPPGSQQTTTAQASSNNNGASALWIIVIIAVILIAAGAWFIIRRKE